MVATTHANQCSTNLFILRVARTHGLNLQMSPLRQLPVRKQRWDLKLHLFHSFEQVAVANEVCLHLLALVSVEVGEELIKSSYWYSSSSNLNTNASGTTPTFACNCGSSSDLDSLRRDTPWPNRSPTFLLSLWRERPLYVSFIAFGIGK